MRDQERHPIVLLSEPHGLPESTRIVTEISSARLQDGGCLTVILEMPGDHQERLDAYLECEASLASVPVHPIIDHPGYRTLLVHLREKFEEGACLTVRGVDEPTDETEGRDRRVSRELVGVASDGTPNLALLGNLQSLREVRRRGRRTHFFCRGVPVSRRDTVAVSDSALAGAVFG